MVRWHHAYMARGYHGIMAPRYYGNLAGTRRGPRPTRQNKNENENEKYENLRRSQDPKQTHPGIT